MFKNILDKQCVCCVLKLLVVTTPALLLLAFLLLHESCSGTPQIQAESEQVEVQQAPLLEVMEP